MEAILFYILAVTALVSALFAITRISPLACALWLVVAFLAVGGIFGLLAAPVVALFQILLAAGAIMVLFIFVVMLIDLDSQSFRGREIKFAKVIGAFAAAYLAAMVVLVLFRSHIIKAPAVVDEYLAPSTLGSLLVIDFAIPFELISVLLLIAIVSAVVMGKKQM